MDPFNIYPSSEPKKPSIFQKILLAATNRVGSFLDKSQESCWRKSILSGIGGIT